MELSKKISIIVPVYNTEKYIRRCVNSILKQTFREFELILIDDGSTDNCPAICDEYAEKDTRIKVIHKTNIGVSAARNTGLEIAEGDYIAFVDSDDWIEPQMYQSMINIAEKYGCDVVMCDCAKDFFEHSEIYTHDIREGYYNYKQLKEEYYPHLLMMENVEYPPTISNCLCLIRKDIINNSNGICLRYVEGVRFSEDLLFGALLMYQAKSFYYMKGETYYHYCMNLSSATHTFDLDKWEDYLNLYHKAEEYFLVKKDFDFSGQIDLMLLFFLYNAIEDIRRTDTLNVDEKKKSILGILNNIHVVEMFKRIKVNRLHISWKLKIITAIYKYKIGLNWILEKEG